MEIMREKIRSNRLRGTRVIVEKHSKIEQYHGHASHPYILQLSRDLHVPRSNYHQCKNGFLTEILTLGLPGLRLRDWA